ncbi:MAG: hypothetical protein LM564_01065 [Desulfurococcaceae archaeon]|nr:hypothetical protein [Desulfurococcaceae archaeon]
MSRSRGISVELPPEGLLIREVATTAINALSYFGEMEVRTYGNLVELQCEDCDYSLRRASEGLKDLLNLKLSKGVRWPPIHKNDRDTLRKSKVVAGSVSALQSYADLVAEFVNWLPRLLNKDLRLSYGETKLVLGDGGMALPQLLKVELYERSLTFGKPYVGELEVRLDDRWLSLLAAGLAVAYAGYIELVTIPEVLESRKTFASLTSVKVAELLEGARIGPEIPYILYVHVLASILAERSFRVSRTAGLTESLAKLFEDYEVPGSSARFRVHRLDFDGKTYREVSREDIAFNAAVLEFLRKVGDRECLEQLKGFIRIASRAGIDTTASKVLNAVTYLYEAIQGAKEAAFVAYYLTRVVAEVSERVRAPFTRMCAEKIIEALVPVGATT